MKKIILLALLTGSLFSQTIQDAVPRRERFYFQPDTEPVLFRSEIMGLRRQCRSVLFHLSIGKHAVHLFFYGEPGITGCRIFLRLSAINKARPSCANLMGSSSDTRDAWGPSLSLGYDYRMENKTALFLRGSGYYHRKEIYRVLSAVFTYAAF